MGKIKKMMLAVLAVFAPLFFSVPVYASSNGFVISAAHVGQTESDKIDASIVSANNLTFSHKTVFNQLGWADYAITLKNNSRNTRRIDAIELNYEVADDALVGYELYKAFLGDYINAEYDDYEDDNVTGAELKPNDTFTLVFSVYVNRNPSNPDEAKTSDSVKINITFTDTEIGEEETEEVIVSPEVPDTGVFGKIEEFSSDTFLATISLTIMSVGLVICTVLILKKQPKSASRVAIIALSVIMLSPLAVHADDNVTQLNINGEIEVNTVLFVKIHYRDIKSGEWVEEYENFNPGEYETIGDYFGAPANWPTPLGFRAVKLVNTADKSDVSLDTKLDKTFDLTIVYEEIPVETYNITYDLNGGRKSDEDDEYPSTYTNVQSISLPRPISDDYDFDGWLIGETENTIIYDTEGRTGDLDLIAQWREKPKTFYNITYMQEMDRSICSSATTPKETAKQFTSTYTYSNNYIPRTTLIDARDGNEYTVVKLADGKCWMASNLRLGGDEPVVLTSDDSDVDKNWTLPASNPQFFIDENNVAFAMDETNGGYYNWYAATAGSGNDTYTNTTGRSMDYAKYSICPKGWKLPSANRVSSTESDVRILANKYKGESYIQNVLTALNITMTGTYSINPYTPTSFSSWSSTTTQDTATLTLSYNPDYYGANTLAAGSLGARTGTMVRCINK